MKGVQLSERSRFFISDAEECRADDVVIRPIYSSIPNQKLTNPQDLQDKKRGRWYNQSRPIIAMTPAARAAKAPVSFFKSAAAALPVEAAGLTVVRDAVAVAVSDASRVGDVGLRVLDTLKVVVDDSVSVPKKGRRVVAVLRIPEALVPEALNPAGADAEPKTRLADEDPAPKLHPSASENRAGL
jgi:hypothetical protein